MAGKRKSPEEILKDLQEQKNREEEKLCKLNERIKDLQARKKAEERKHRNHCLIVMGTAIETVTGQLIDDKTEADKQTLSVIIEQLKLGRMRQEHPDKDEVRMICEEVLGRKITEKDLPKLRSFLHHQNERGGYYIAAMGGNKVE